MSTVSLLLLWLLVVSCSSNRNVDFLKQCCDSGLSSSSRLLDCVHFAAKNNEIQINSKLYRDGGPSIMVALVSYATDDISDYAAYSFAVNAAYTEKNRYAIRMLNDSTFSTIGTDSRWNKVKILEEALTTWASDYDYVMWVDADLIILDFNLRLEAIAAQHPTAALLASAEHAGSTTLINTGTILVRNCNWSINFLSKWWSFADRNLFSDQEQFDMLYKAQLDLEGSSFKERIVVLPPDVLNSDPPAMTQQTPRSQVLHLMGEHTNYRIRVFRSAFQEVCRSTLLSTPLYPQLTATQENLLKWTIEEYSEESARLMKLYRSGAERGNMNLSASRDMANAAHHFAHALEHSSTSASTPMSHHAPIDAIAQAEDIRKQVFKLLSLNLQMKRNKYSRHFIGNTKNSLKFNKDEVVSIAGTMNEQGFDTMPLRDWPELLKIVATAGQHLLHIGSATERNVVISQLMALFDEMLEWSHPQQHPAIMHMVSYVRSQEGVLAIDRGDTSTALEAFQESLYISEQLAALSGSHILVSPLSAAANILSEIGSYTEAHLMYARALQLSSDHVGAEHESNVNLLVNYGMSLYHSCCGVSLPNDGLLAISILTTCRDTLSKSKFIFNRARSLLMKQLDIGGIHSSLDDFPIYALIDRYLRIFKASNV